MHRRHSHAAPAETPSAGPSRMTLLVLLCLAQLMVILDISAVNVALPDMARDLGIRRADVGWTITSYSLIFGSLLLLGGRSADLIGRRRVFLTGLGIFTLSSLASAVAGDGTSLFAARAGQGLGAAMLSPAALSIIMSAFREGRERATALAAWGAVGGAGAAIGVLLGGTLTELVGWRAIFFVNLPIGAVAVLTGAADEESGMFSSLNTTGHEIGGSIGVAVLTTVATGAVVSTSAAGLGGGIGDAFMVAAAIAGVAGVAALVVLPSASMFLPRFRLAPPVAVH